MQPYAWGVLNFTGIPICRQRLTAFTLRFFNRIWDKTSKTEQIRRSLRFQDELSCRIKEKSNHCMYFNKWKFCFCIFIKWLQSLYCKGYPKQDTQFCTIRCAKTNGLQVIVKQLRESGFSFLCGPNQRYLLVEIRLSYWKTVSLI